MGPIRIQLTQPKAGHAIEAVLVLAFKSVTVAIPLLSSSLHDSASAAEFSLQNLWVVVS